jgi:ferredoxin
MKIILDQKKCIGCGSCAALDSKNFKMIGSKVILIDSKETDEKMFEKEIKKSNDTQDASDSCPVMCIEIRED